MEEEIERLLKLEKIIKKAAKVLRVKVEDLPRVIRRFKNEIKEMEKELNELDKSA